MGRVINFIDDCTRADNADVGPYWDAGYTSMDPAKIASNTIQATQTGVLALESINAGGTFYESWIEGRLGAHTGASVIAAKLLLCCAAPPTRTFYRATTRRNDSGGNTAFIQKSVNGVESGLVSDTTHPWNAADLMRFELRNGTLWLFQNDILILSTPANDNNITAGRGGIQLEVAVGGTLANCSFNRIAYGPFMTSLQPTWPRL